MTVLKDHKAVGKNELLQDSLWRQNQDFLAQGEVDGGNRKERNQQTELPSAGGKGGRIDLGMTIGPSLGHANTEWTVLKKQRTSVEFRREVWPGRMNLCAVGTQILGD